MSKTQREMLLILCVCVIAAAPFLSSLRGQFTNWDDQVNVTENLQLAKGLRYGLIPIWSRGYQNLYIPVTYTVYWVGWHLWGASAFGFHLVNLLCHMANVALLYLILRRLLSAKLGVFFAVLWWGMHPLNVEPVAWITGLKDVLSGLFMFLSLCLYMEWREGERRTWRMWGASLVVFVLACLSKPAAVTFPMVLVGYDLFVGRRTWRTFGASIPFFVISIIIIVLTMLVQNPAERGVVVPGILGRLRLMGDATLFYLKKLVWPIGLSPLYNRSIAGVLSDKWSWVYPVIVCGVVIAAFRLFPRWRFGMVIFLAGLAPVSGVASFSYQKHATVADRYTYFPLIGVSLIIGEVISCFSQTKRHVKWKVVASGCLTAWILLLGIAARNQVGVWRSSLTLWQRVVEGKADSAAIRCNLGGAWLAQGRCDRAINEYRLAIAVQPDFVSAYCGRGVAYAGMGEMQKAIQDYDKAIEIQPDYAPAHCNRSAAWGAKGYFEQAIKDATRAIEINPAYADAYYNRGVTLNEMGDFDEAIKNFSCAIEINPTRGGPYCSRAISYYNIGKYTAAWSDVKRCRELGAGIDPAFFEALKKNLARSE